MTVTLTQDNVLGRIRVDADGLAAADHASIERSVDQITWTMCRGGSEWPVAAGAFSNPFDDYEFPDGVQVFYRVRGLVLDTAPSFVSAGTASTGSAGSRTPGLPASLVAGDAVIIPASTRNSGTGTVDDLANWTTLATSGNFKLLGRIYDGVWTMPTVTYTGGAANEDTIAQSIALRGVGLEVATSNAILNGSAQNINLPVLAMTEDDCTVLLAAWKADDWTGASAIGSGWLEAQEATSTAGNDAAQVVDYYIQTDAVDVPAGFFTITGGGAAISRCIAVALRRQAYLNEQIEDITPDLTGVWIKSLRRPYLNRLVNVLDYSDITRASNNEVFRVVGRTYGVGVADVMSGRRWTMTVWTETTSDADDLDTVFAAGDIWFVHVPIDCTVPGGYVVVVGDVVRRKTRAHAVRRHFDLPFEEVAAPDDDVVGSSSTWATVIASYATWEDLIADKATWADVLELIGSPDEVIVP